MSKNACVFCGYVDERHDKMNYCSQCGKLGHALYRSFFDTTEGRSALSKAVPGLTEQQLLFSSRLDAINNSLAAGESDE